MRIIIVISMLGLIPSVAQAADVDPQSYVGLKYQNPPEGISLQNHWIVREDNQDYWVRLAVKGKTRMFWLERMYCCESPRIVEVLAVLVEPPLKKGEYFLSDCRIQGNEETSVDSSFIGIVKWRGNKREWLPAVHYAWKIDLEKKNFVPISPDSIECIYKSSGH